MMTDGLAANFQIRFLRLMVVAILCVGVWRAEAGGVTLITHGFNSDVASWIIPMQGRVTRYGALSPTNTACYEITITQNGQGQYVPAATFLSGTNPVVASSGEILIKLNWSTLSGLGGASTTTIANNDEVGTTKQVLLSPMEGWFAFPSTWNANAAELHALIRASAKWKQGEQKSRDTSGESASSQAI